MSLLLTPFSEKDFDASRRIVRGPPDYPMWAAKTANEVVTLYREAQSLREILETVRLSRCELARSMKHPEAERFGAPRLRESVTHLNLGHAFFLERAGRHCDTLLMGPLRFYPDPPLPSLIPRMTRQTFYRLISARDVPTTRLGRYLRPAEIPPHRFESGTLVLEHTPASLIGTIIEDVFVRLDQLSALDPGDEARAIFFEAMYGFYHAMPFQRGSAAIGRSFFSGVYMALFKMKLLLPPDPDLMAMTALDQKDYRQELLGRRFPLGEHNFDSNARTS